MPRRTIHPYTVSHSQNLSCWHFPFSATRIKMLIIKTCQSKAKKIITQAKFISIYIVDQKSFCLLQATLMPSITTANASKVPFFPPVILKVDFLCRKLCAWQPLHRPSWWVAETLHAKLSCNDMNSHIREKFSNYPGRTSNKLQGI